MIEVSIPMQERISVCQAKRGNQAVDGFAHGPTVPPESAEVLG
jgi:hypothetical protein